MRIQFLQDDGKGGFISIVVSNPISTRVRPLYDIYQQDFSKYKENGYFAFFKSRFKSRINDHLTKNK